MGTPSFALLFQGSDLKLVNDNPRGHRSQHAPSPLRRKRDGSLTSRPKSCTSPPVSPTRSHGKKPQLSRWDTSSCTNSPIMPTKLDERCSPPSLKRMLASPPSSASSSLKNVLKPVRRQSIDTQDFDSFMYGSSTATIMSQAELLTTVLKNITFSSVHDVEADDDDDDYDNTMLVDSSIDPFLWKGRRLLQAALYLYLSFFFPTITNYLYPWSFHYFHSYHHPMAASTLCHPWTDHSGLLIAL